MTQPAALTLAELFELDDGKLNVTELLEVGGQHGLNQQAIRREWVRRTVEAAHRRRVERLAQQQAEAEALVQAFREKVRNADLDQLKEIIIDIAEGRNHV